MKKCNLDIEYDDFCEKDVIVNVELKPVSEILKMLNHPLNYYEEYLYVEQFVYYWMFERDLLFQNHEWVLYGYMYDVKMAMINLSMFVRLRPDLIKLLKEDLGSEYAHMFEIVFKLN